MRNHIEAKFILGALLASLSAAPAVLAQSQSQTSAQDSSQAAAPAKTQEQSDASAFVFVSVNSGKNTKRFGERTANAIAGSSATGIAW